MSRPSRRVRRAIRITPAADRPRYAPEWQGDLAAASELGLSAADVAGGAMRVARRLRARQFRRVLDGTAGPWPTTGAWAILLPVMFLFAGPLLLVTGIVGTLLAFIRASRVSWRAGRILMLGFASVWVISTAMYWWLWNVGFNALDAGRPLPPIMTFYQPAFFVGLAAFLAFWITVAVNLRRAPHIVVT